MDKDQVAFEPTSLIVPIEKNDLTECATINDLILGKGQVTPENIVPTG